MAIFPGPVGEILREGTCATVDIEMRKGNVVDIDGQSTYLIQGIDSPTLPAHAPVRMYITISANVFLIP